MLYMLVDMEIEILEERTNPFFKRKELKIILKHEGSSTPSKQELKKELASKFSLSEERVKIDYIFTRKGSCESFAKVKILEKGEKVETQASQNQ
ncbi:MAG: hypothetical protein QXP77_02750 [Candidatus Aenigmatarchaeota archaeon]